MTVICCGIYVQPNLHQLDIYFFYVFKGEDHAALKLSQQQAIDANIVNEENEIDLYLSGRIVTSEEGFWRLMGFPLIEISPSSELLPVILQDEQYVTIHENESTENLKDRIEEMKYKVNNKLEAFFKLNELRLHELK